MEIQKRNINIDLVKTIAVFSVISVHFFSNAGFYDKVISKNMYLGVFFRTLFMICVPLFIITTGYLMKNKTLDKKYYLKISRVLIIYVIDAIIYLAYRALYLGEPFSIKHIVKCILEFDIGYSWYIEMYIGLFLLIPFINLIYNNLKSKKEKKILILTMLFLTSFQGILNIKHNLMPDWWVSLYPLTYYFIGCYLREYKIELKKYKNILMFLICLIISTLINIWLSHGSNFVWSIHNDWGSILNVLTSSLIFIFIINLNLQNINMKLKRIISKISELSLGIYLTSSIIDNFLYFDYFANINFLSFIGYFKIVPLVFTLSASLSMIINIIYKIIDKYIVNKINKIFIK